ncbi:hypothetical protein ABIE62_000331 [Porphyrobacter sp. MBR-155]|jgi:hypothetical protein|uniref:hypothetical protein n=1 Tax=Porphyrobacter sp. MBR-155 TaxID=3156464 RepID=UPI0033910F0D
MALKIHVLALAGALAGTTILAAPATAAELPRAQINLGAVSAAFDHSRFDPASVTADYRCRWGCRRGHRGGHFRGGHGRNRIGGGDVLIGAAIIGGAIAIANANNRRNRDRDRDVVIVERDADDPNYNPRYQERRNDNRRAAPRGTGSSGLDSAVDQCLTRIERDVRVDSVDNVQRTGAGWLVSGALFNGSGFQCRIGNNGQIDGIDYSGGFSSAAPAIDSDRAEGQWSEQRYADARLAMGGMAQPQAVAPSAPTTPVVAGPMPAYPGGPIPGEEIPETIDGDL